MKDLSQFLKRLRSLAKRRILFLPHAIRQMSRPTRMIKSVEVRRVVGTGELIEDYPDDPRGHSCLLLGHGSGDVFLLMEDGFDVDQMKAESRLLFEHGSAQVYLGASIFWPGRLAVLTNEEAAIADWQIKRDGSRRGIVEIISEKKQE